MGFSLEEEREKRLAAQAYKANADIDMTDDVHEALAMLDKASDSKGMSAALQKPVYRRIVNLLADGKIGAGDLIKLAGMIADRVDGKVTDKVEVSGTIGLAAILADINGRSAGLPDLSEMDDDVLDAVEGDLQDDNVLDIIDAEVVD